MRYAAAFEHTPGKKTVNGARPSAARTMEAGASPGTRIRSTRAGPFAATTGGATAVEARVGGENARGSTEGTCRAPESCAPIRSARATRATSQPDKKSTARPTAIRIMPTRRTNPTKCDPISKVPALPTKRSKVSPLPTEQNNLSHHRSVGSGSGGKPRRKAAGFSTRDAASPHVDLVHAGFLGGPPTGRGKHELVALLGRDRSVA